MSTNATITVKCNDGKFRQIYTHWDGYPNHNGRILQQDYQDQKKIEALVALGDISILASSIECPAGHSFRTPIAGCTVAYGRDRGEKGVSAQVFDTLKESQKKGLQQFNYYWDGEKWFVNNELLEEFLSSLPD